MPDATPTPRKRPPKPPGPGRTGRPPADPAGRGVRCRTVLTPTVAAYLADHCGGVYRGLKVLAEAAYAAHAARE